MKLEKLFATHILERGFGYYKSGAVKSMEITDNKIEAVVCGSTAYKVNINTDGDNVTGMTCSCPYAVGGNYCKHMAAVLYKWSECKEENTKTNDDTHQSIYEITDKKKKAEAVKALVDSAKEEDIRSFLTSVLLESEKLLIAFDKSVNKQPKETSLKRYYRQIDEIEERYTDPDGFIRYYHTADYASELGNVIDECIGEMTESLGFSDAFKLLNYIFNRLDNVVTDEDEYGYIDDLADKIYDEWTDIISKAGEEDRKIMSDTLLSDCGNMAYSLSKEYRERAMCLLSQFSQG
jgi:hypothetical protein